MLRCAEINSSFHRPHAEATDAKWAASTPADFRVAVKLPRIITHDQKLQRARHAGAVVCEPRHESWFSAAADALLVHYEVGRVAVDPPPAAGAARPGG